MMMVESFAEIHARRVAEGLEDCDPSCLNATEKVCTCSCGGRNHGRDAKKNAERLAKLNHHHHEDRQTTLYEGWN